MGEAAEDEGGLSESYYVYLSSIGKRNTYFDYLLIVENRVSDVVTSCVGVHLSIRCDPQLNLSIHFSELLVFNDSPVVTFEI